MLSIICFYDFFNVCCNFFFFSKGPFFCQKQIFCHVFLIKAISHKGKHTGILHIRLPILPTFLWTILLELVHVKSETIFHFFVFPISTEPHKSNMGSRVIKNISKYTQFEYDTNDFFYLLWFTVGEVYFNFYIGAAAESVWLQRDQPKVITKLTFSYLFRTYLHKNYSSWPFNQLPRYQKKFKG